MTSESPSTLPHSVPSRLNSETADLAQATPSVAATAGTLDPAQLTPGTIVAKRYRIGTLIATNGTLQRYRGNDLASGQQSPLPIIILCQKADKTDDPNPGDQATARWPSVDWEKRLLSRSAHLSLPRALDSFVEDGRTYLVEELPEGRSFWDAWEDTPASWPRRCAWLIQLAEALDRLHRAGAIVELSPERIVVSPMEQAVIADLSTLLPLPVPGGEPTRPGRCTAPELLLGNGIADGRAAMWSFGAMVHSLLLGRELTDFDFTPLGRPRAYVERFPDAHPLLGRLLGRTFAFEQEHRFPSPERREGDPSGARELIELLEICSRNLDAIRLEISAWTSTGLVRSANEDAVAVLHSAESGLEENDDFALLVLADGMGGMAGGEVAAAMTIQSVRDYFLKQPPFTDLLLRPSTAPATPILPTKDPLSHGQRVKASLREANRVVLERSLAETPLRGMGCTAEVVLIDGRQVCVGHVGDSRTYHFRRGKLTQVTQDQTLVSRLVLLGQLTEEEAEHHPQRAELQQAIGGRSDVYPDEHILTIEPGDWLLVCTDGLTNMLRPAAMIDVLQAAGSAEKAARRLVNQALLAGGSDNVSLIVVRVC